jgi:hypothetical protein
LGGSLVALLMLLWSTGCVRVEQTLTVERGRFRRVLAHSVRHGGGGSGRGGVAGPQSQLAEEGVCLRMPWINPFEFDEAEVRKDFEAYRSNWV